MSVSVAARNGGSARVGNATGDLARCALHARASAAWNPARWAVRRVSGPATVVAIDGDPADERRYTSPHASLHHVVDMS